MASAPDQKKLQTWDLPAREERCQADYQEVGSWSSSPDLMKFSSSIFCYFLFCIIFHQVPNPKVLKFKIASMEQESDQLRLALDVKVRQLDLWHSSHVLFWNSKVELKFETKFLFCTCSCVWKKNIFTHIYFTMNCIQEVPIGFISWLSELYARLSPIPFMIQIFCNAMRKIGLSW